MFGIAIVRWRSFLFLYEFNENASIYFITKSGSIVLYIQIQLTSDNRKAHLILIVPIFRVFSSCIKALLIGANTQVKSETPEILLADKIVHPKRQLGEYIFPGKWPISRLFLDGILYSYLTITTIIVTWCKRY